MINLLKSLSLELLNMEINNFIKHGKLNIIIDGQFGSTGKGLIASYIGINNHIDLAIGRLSPNAGHTFYFGNPLEKYVTRMLPVCSITNKESLIYLCAGSVIDVDILLKELKEFNIDDSRLFIHPRAAIITKKDKEEESKNNNILKVASTQSGSGSARANKIMRSNPLACNTPELSKYIKEFDLDIFTKNNASIIVETSQGFDLSLQFGLSYPYCTSTDIIPSAILADIGAHPRCLGNVMMTVRTYPIRVGNTNLGYSGDVYSDSKECSWKELGLEKELTTVTKRERRIFTFSKQQYMRSLKFIQPDYVFLNFMNYLKNSDLEWIKNNILSVRKPDFLGYGKTYLDIFPYSLDIIKEKIIN